MLSILTSMILKYIAIVKPVLPSLLMPGHRLLWLYKLNLAIIMVIYIYLVVHVYI